MIKVPATEAGVPAIEALTAEGVNVNVTLLFSVERYEQVMQAYLGGLERRAHAGEPVHGISSIASFFVSRVDAKADALLPPDSPLRGEVAIANAHRAYGRYLERFAGERWDALSGLGARPQRPLWASTGTKDPAYSDVLYVERLIARGVVNTMPEQTLRAFSDHGNVGCALDADVSEAERVLAEAAETGLDLGEITATLEREGVHSFCSSYSGAAGLHQLEATRPRGIAASVTDVTTGGLADSDAVVQGPSSKAWTAWGGRSLVTSLPRGVPAVALVAAASCHPNPCPAVSAIGASITLAVLRVRARARGSRRSSARCSSRRAVTSRTMAYRALACR